MTSPQTHFLLALSLVKGIGPASLKRIAAIERFWEGDVAALCAAVPPLARALDSKITDVWLEAQEAAQRQIDSAKKYDTCILSPLDANYPRLLAATKDDPFLLFVRGVLAQDQDKSVAIIGTREPTPTGEVIAKRIASSFAEQGWSIVSGLALGCDAIAHRSALEANGHTVAVLAHGLQMIAPSRHQKLASDILDAGGALVSEYIFGQGVQGQQFVKRDRTQAGMAQGVVMIQSDVKGGSLHASRAALDYKRWLAVPYPTNKDVQQGEPKVQANLLIADGMPGDRAALLRCSTADLDRVLILRGREDILRLAGAPDISTGSLMPPMTDACIAEVASVRHGDLMLDSDFSASPSLPQMAVGEIVDAIRDECGFSANLDEKNAHVEHAPRLVTEATHTSIGDINSVIIEQGAPNEPYLEPQATPLITSSKRKLRYRVLTLGGRDSLELKISQPPAWMQNEIGSRLQSPRQDAILFNLSKRLEHLQVRLDEVNRSRSPVVRSFNEAFSLQLHFTVEDVVMHMKRCVDELSKLEFSKDVRALINLPPAGNQAQMSLIESKLVDEDLAIDLSSVLNYVVKSLPLSVSTSSGAHGAKATALRKDEVDIGLDDLVRSFNVLLGEALGNYKVAQSAPQVGATDPAS